MFYPIEHKSKIESGLVTEGNLPIWVKFSIFQRFSPKPETDENKKVWILFQQKKERAETIKMSGILMRKNENNETKEKFYYFLGRARNTS